MVKSKTSSKKLGTANISYKTQYYYLEFKKMRCEIQECGSYQPCRIFIKNTLAVEITMSSAKTQAAIFRDKFEVNQHDKVLHKQQSLGLRLKRLFPYEDIIEEYFDLHYRTDFTFKKHVLVVDFDEKGRVDRDPDYERKRRKGLEKLDYHIVRINPDKIDEEFGRVSAYIAESIKKQTEESTKKSLVDDFSKRVRNTVKNL